MAIYYVDYVSGNDTTGDGSSGNPYRTYVKVKSTHSPTGADETRVAKTTISSTSAANCTFTEGTKTIATSASLVGIVAVDDYVGKGSTATAPCGGNGNHETLYRVTAITATTITLDQNYYDSTRANPTEVVSELTYITPVYEADQDPFIITGGDKVTGGWDLGTVTRNGETWLRFQRTGSAYAVNCNTGSTFQYMNVCRSERGIYVGEPNGLTAGYCYDCTFVYSGYTGVRIYPLGVVERVVTNGTEIASTSYAPFEWHGGTADDLLVIGDSYPVLFTNQTLPVGATDVNNGTKSITVYAKGATYAVYWAAQQKFNGLTNFTILGNPTNHIAVAPYDGIIIKDLTLDGGDTGFNFLTQNSYMYIENCTVKNMTSRGAYLSQNRYSYFKDCTFESNYRDIQLDTYTGDATFVGCTFTTPTDYSLYPDTNNVGIITCQNCTIDAPSLAKAFRYITGTTTTNGINYVFIDSFGYNGVYYPHASVLQSSAVLSPNTSSNTLAITLNTTITGNVLDIPIWGTYVGLNQGRSITIYYKSTSGSWSGSIVPKLKLNGTVVTTGSTINSVGTGWTSYGISVPNGSVTESGLLTLELTINSNTAPIYFGDVEVS